MSTIGIRHTRTDIEKLRISNHIVAQVHKELKKLVKSGTATAYIDEVATALIKELGGSPAFKGYKGYPYTTCISVNNTIVHGFPSSYELKEGDLVSVDVGVLKEGYYGDACFSEVVGVEERPQRLLNATYACLDLAIDLIEDGVTTGDIGYAIHRYAKANNYDVIRDFVGHGIGCVLHDGPTIKNFGNKNTGFKLKEDMAICIEPMLVEGTHEYIKHPNGWEIQTKDGKLAAHVEHCVLVTKNGCEILSK